MDLSVSTRGNTVLDARRPLQANQKNPLRLRRGYK